MNKTLFLIATALSFSQLGAAQARSTDCLQGLVGKWNCVLSSEGTGSYKSIHIIKAYESGKYLFGSRPSAYGNDANLTYDIVQSDGVSYSVSQIHPDGSEQTNSDNSLATVCKSDRKISQQYFSNAFNKKVIQVDYTLSGNNLSIVSVVYSNSAGPETTPFPIKISEVCERLD
jgi:hypothetical protein